MKRNDIGDLEPSHMYILKCADDTLYVGSTTDLQKRIWQHNAGLGSSYTRHRRPVEVVYTEEFSSVRDAYLREKQIQGWSRAKREALITGELDQLKANMPSRWKRDKELDKERRRRRNRASG